MLNTFKIRATPLGSITDIVRQDGGLFWIRFKGTDNVYPVQSVQMIKMNDVIVLELGTHEKVAYDSCIFGDLDAHGIIDCPHRGQSMGVGSDPARALHKMMGIPRIASLQDQLDPSEHLA